MRYEYDPIEIVKEIIVVKNILEVASEKIKNHNNTKKLIEKILSELSSLQYIILQNKE